MIRDYLEKKYLILNAKIENGFGASFSISANNILIANTVLTDGSFFLL